MAGKFPPPAIPINPKMKARMDQLLQDHELLALLTRQCEESTYFVREADYADPSSDLKCTECQVDPNATEADRKRIFKHRSALNAHLKSSFHPRARQLHEAWKAEKAASGSSTVACSWCGIATETLPSFMYHIELHHPEELSAALVGKPDAVVAGGSSKENTGRDESGSSQPEEGLSPCVGKGKGRAG